MAEAKPINGRWDAFSTKWWPWSLLLLDAVTPTLLWSVLCCTRHLWKCRADTARSCLNPCRTCWPESHTTGLPTANCCGRLYWEMLGPTWQDFLCSTWDNLYIPRTRAIQGVWVSKTFLVETPIITLKSEFNPPTCPKEVPKYFTHIFGISIAK